MPQPTSFQIPESRTPFPNTELAIVTRRGKKWLAIGNVGAVGSGRIYFIDPQNGDCEFRTMPEFERGAYMLQTAVDGKLYLGGINGSLSCYDPETDRIEPLVKDQLVSIVWGGCVTQRYVVFSASPADACVYDWREKKVVHTFKPVDLQTPPARYGHRVVECPDGKVLLAMNVPHCRMIVLDPASGERKSLVPEGLEKKEWTRDATFLDSESLIVFSKGETLFYRYPSFELIGRIPPPAGVEHFYGRVAILKGRVHAMADGILRRLKEDRSGWENIDADITGGDKYGTLIKLDDDTIGCVNVAGVYSRLNVRTGEVFRRELETPALVPSHALCVVPELNKIYGAPFINMRFWDIDVKTGAGRDMGRASMGGGQVNQIVWEPQTRRVLMACYTSCTVSAYDPTKGGKYPDNPKVLARVEDMQMRPKSTVHDGRYLWMATSPLYGHLGGAISRIDPLDGSHKTWRHIVKDQTPNRIVADPANNRIYFSTEIYADCDSCPATTDAGHLVAFDTKELKIVTQSAPFEKADIVIALALLSPTHVLAMAKGNLFTWEPAKNKITPIGPAPKGLNEVVVDSQGRLYTSAEEKIFRIHIEPGSVRFHKLADGAGKFLCVADGKLWYIVDPEVRAIELN